MFFNVWRIGKPYMLTKDPRVKQPCLHRNLPTIGNRFNCVFSSCLVPRECRIPQAVCKAHFKPVLAAGMCPNECVLVAVPHAVAKEGQGGVYFWNPLTFERMRGWLQIRRPCFGLWAIPLIVGVSRVECIWQGWVVDSGSQPWVMNNWSQRVRICLNLWRWSC